MSGLGEKSERRKRALQMGQDEVPVTQIAKLLKTPRSTVVKWLESAGVQPTMLRKQRRSRGGGALSAGKVLSIEEGVRKRIEAMEDPPDEAA
jgi:hypothetical protein